MTDAAGKTEDETEEENVQADECTIKVGKEEMEEDITNGILLLVEDWEESKEEEEKSMRKLVRKSHTLGGRHNQVFLLKKTLLLSSLCTLLTMVCTYTQSFRQLLNNF